MRIKIKSPERIVLGFTKQEIAIINNCLNESCHGLLMDRFLPARDDLIEMLDYVQDIHAKQDFYRLKTVPV